MERQVRVTGASPESRPESGDLLAQMCVAARGRVERARVARPLTRPRAVPRERSLLDALWDPPGGGLAVIAEIKRASPSRGALAPKLDAAAQARRYAAAGAAAVSVLTEPDRFGGSLADLYAAAAACDLPLLRKDFIVDTYQLWEAAAAGASGVLLIAAALSGDELAKLFFEAYELGLDALVEVHSDRDVQRANELCCPLVGINNRDLRTLAVDVSVTERLAPRLHDYCLIVSESGLADASDVRRVARAGAHAILVGEAFVRASLAPATDDTDPVAAAIDEFRTAADERGRS